MEKIESLHKKLKNRNILTEQLQNSYILDIVDMLELEKDIINNIIAEIQETQLNETSCNCIASMVENSHFILHTIYMNFLQ